MIIALVFLYWLNIGREETINSAPITGVKEDNNIEIASKEDIKVFWEIQKSWDLKAKLNPFIHKRIWNARQTMVSAVQQFNNPYRACRLESFLVLSIMAWTYLLQAVCEEEDIPMYKNKHYSSLRELLKMEKLNQKFTKGARDNLEYILDLRNEVSHSSGYTIPDNMICKIQACCFNFNEYLVKFFGKKRSLEQVFDIALQFASISKEQASSLFEQEVSKKLVTFDTEYDNKLDEDVLKSKDYQFTVTFILVSRDNSKKAQKAFEFIKPESAKGKEIETIVLKEVTSDKIYPYKLGKMEEILKGEFPQLKISAGYFLARAAIIYYKVRPSGAATNKELTDKTYCIYHEAHGDYTYSKAYLERLQKDLRSGKYDKIYKEIKKKRQ